MEAWGFIWVMVILKIPLVMLLWFVWWAVHAKPEPTGREGEDDGGLGLGHPHDRPLPPAPRRRGPHGEPLPQPPARVRAPVKAPAPERR